MSLTAVLGCALGGGRHVLSARRPRPPRPLPLRARAGCEAPSNRTHRRWRSGRRRAGSRRGRGGCAPGSRWRPPRRICATTALMPPADPNTRSSDVFSVFPVLVGCSIAIDADVTPWLSFLPFCGTGRCPVLGGAYGPFYLEVEGNTRVFFSYAEGCILTEILLPKKCSCCCPAKQK